MTIEDRPSTMNADMNPVEPDAGAIKATGWEHFDAGATVLSADGEEIGTVRERLPQYLQVRVSRNLLTDEEMYVPRTLVERVEGDKVYLNRSSAELEEMDLKTPPALQ